MPMHDWTRVAAGIYHATHNSWISRLQDALNSGLLPSEFYALGEQHSGNVQPDVLTLRTEGLTADDDAFTAEVGGESSMLAVAEAPPRVRLAQQAENDVYFYLQKQRRIVIRHVTGDRVVAFIEIVSPANKHTEQTVDDFLDKVEAGVRDRIHVMIVDPFPPSAHDPRGMHAAVWERLGAGDYDPPQNEPLTLASYCATRPVTAYVEPFRVGASLVDMPLFLTTEHYVPVPLESTYMQAWSGVPRRWKSVIEGEVSTA